MPFSFCLVTNSIFQIWFVKQGYVKQKATVTYSLDSTNIPFHRNDGHHSSGFNTRPWRYPSDTSNRRSRRRFYYPEEFTDFPNYMDWAYRLANHNFALLIPDKKTEIER